MTDEPRKLIFPFDRPVTVRACQDQQYTESGRPFRLELDMPEGPVHFSYEEWVRFAQTVAVLLRPRLLLED